jgi:hypothetical protein
LTRISSELANFLGKPVGTEMARTEVTLEINTYIRAHNLQDPNNGRRIFADAKLRKLLKLTKEDELTYFNLQRYMSPHFAKATKKVCDTNTLFARYTEGGLKVIFLAQIVGAGSTVKFEYSLKTKGSKWVELSSTYNTVEKLWQSVPWTKGNPNYSQRLSINGLVVDITDEPGALSRNCIKQ